MFDYIVITRVLGTKEIYGCPSIETIGTFSIRLRSNYVDRN